MSTVRADRRLLTGALLTALLILPLLAACSGDEPGVTPQPPAEERTDRIRGGQVVAAPDVVRGIGRLLDRRTDALLHGDRAGFLAGVAPTARAAQSTYFDNLGRLPLATYDLALDRGALVRDGKGYWAEVDVTVQLADYDEVPVVARDRYRFVPGRGDRLVLSSMVDPAWEERHGVVPQPWEKGPMTVVQGSHALGLFDAGSAGSAGQVVADVEAGIAAVSAEVPYDWDGRVVVYALSSPDFLAGLDGLPGGDPLALDAVTFPVPASPGGGGYAGTRFVLNPRMVVRPGPARNRLIRHELAHVALGERQDDAPTWFAEGLAEYVSVRPLAPHDRAISGAALEAAEKGLTALPDDDTFNGPQSQANYGVAWWACEYLAKTYDESTLWVLLDAMSGAEDPDAVLEGVLQVDERTLARRAGRLMLATYRPEPDETPSEEPSEDPTQEPGEESSDGPTDEPEDGPRDEPGGDSDDAGSGRSGRAVD